MREPITAREFNDGTSAAKALITARPSVETVVKYSKRQWKRVLSLQQAENLIKQVSEGVACISNIVPRLPVQENTFHVLELLRLQRKHAEYLRSINFGQPNQLTKQKDIS